MTKKYINNVNMYKAIEDFSFENNSPTENITLREIT